MEHIESVKEFILLLIIGKISHYTLNLKSSSLPTTGKRHLCTELHRVISAQLKIHANTYIDIE